MLTDFANALTVPRPLHSPVNRISTLFDRFFNDDFFAPLTAQPLTGGVPLCMWEDDDYLHVEVDAPGMTEKDIDVAIHQGSLVIRGERKCERKGSGYDTRTYGQFEQRISLPYWATSDKVEAKLANGVLSLAFPKSEEARSRRIAVHAE